MDRLTAMRVFIEVAERGSLTGAGERLELSRAMVSRYIASLEQWLGARLLHRTTRRVSLSDAGQQALSGCRRMVEMADQVVAAAGARRSEPVGKLRVTTSPSFAQAQLTAAVVAFQQRHPRVEVELFVIDRAVHLVDERIDLAVRITNTLDESFVARRLATCNSVLCAAPAYLQRFGAPKSAADLRMHNCITHAFAARTEYRLRHNGQPLTVAVGGSLSCNETGVLLEAALAGAGVAMLPGVEPEPLGIHAVYLSRRHQPQALRLLIEFLAERFGGALAPWDRELQRQRSRTLKASRKPS